MIEAHWSAWEGSTREFRGKRDEGRCPTFNLHSKDYLALDSSFKGGCSARLVFN
jgi:hypothetical protein